MAEDSSEIVREMAESVAATNVKVVSEGPSVFVNLAYGNAIAHQQSMNQINLAATGKIVESIIETRPSEGGVDVAALQQLIKGAQTTPPVT